MPSIELNGIIGFVVITAIKTTLMLAAAAIITLTLKAGAARARALVWATAIAGVLVLPLIAVVAPPFPVSIPQFNFFETRGVNVIQPPVTGVAFDGATHNTVNIVSGSMTTEGATAGRPVAATTQVNMGWLVALAILWCLGAGAVLFTVLLGMLRAGRLRRRSVPLGATQWRTALEDARKTTGVERPLDLRLANVTSPMTWGFARPVIVMPLSSIEWDDETRRMVLVHELTHIAQHDWLFRLCGRFACALYWFNPVVWHASRRLVTEMETACDDAVILCGSKPSRYATRLIAIAREREITPVPFGALAMARRTQLEGRIMSILEKQSTRKTSKRSRIAPVLLAVIIALVAVAQPQSRPHEEPPAPKASIQPLLAHPVPIPIPTPISFRPPVRAPRASMILVPALAGLPRASAITVGGGSHNFIYTLDDDTSVRVVIQGSVEFSEDATDVIGLARKSTVRVSVLQNDVEREVVYKRKRGGDVRRELFVDGNRVTIIGDAEEFVRGATQVAAQLVENNARTSELVTHGSLEDEVDSLFEKLRVIETELHSLDDKERRLLLRELREDAARLIEGSRSQRDRYLTYRTLYDQMSEDLESRLKHLSETSRKLDQVR